MNFLAKWRQPEDKGFQDRRKEPRHKPIEGAFAFLSLTAMVAGQIIDINEQGLSFRYVASRQKVDGKCLVDIIVRNGAFHCERMPCETVWDRADPETFSLGPFSMRFCGIRFDKLTENHRSQLKSFIRQFVDPHAQD